MDCFGLLVYFCFDYKCLLYYLYDRMMEKQGERIWYFSVQILRVMVFIVFDFLGSFLENLVIEEI